MAHSRKDYEAVAEIINDTSYTVHMDLPTVTTIAVALADLFEAGNERFDRARFLKACFIPKARS